MATPEQIEKLRHRAEISEEEAREALAVCQDDLLEALIYLEQQGKVAPPASGSYSSREEPTAGGNVEFDSEVLLHPRIRFFHRLKRQWRK